MARRRPRKKIDQPKTEALDERLNRRYNEASRKKSWGIVGWIIGPILLAAIFIATYWFGIDLWAMALRWWG